VGLSQDEAQRQAFRILKSVATIKLFSLLPSRSESKARGGEATNRPRSTNRDQTRTRNAPTADRDLHERRTLAFARSSALPLSSRELCKELEHARARGRHSQPFDVPHDADRRVHHRLAPPPFPSPRKNGQDAHFPHTSFSPEWKPKVRRRSASALASHATLTYCNVTAQRTHARFGRLPSATGPWRPSIIGPSPRCPFARDMSRVSIFRNNKGVAATPMAVRCGHRAMR
jgi:hypothetical protein